MGGTSILWRRCHPIIMWGHGVREGSSSALVLSASIAAILLVGTLPSPVMASGDKPSWSVGDYWEYEGWVYYYPSFKQRIEVLSEEMLFQNGKSYSAFKLLEQDTYSYGSLAGTVNYTLWYQSTDLSLIRTEADLSYMIPPNATATVTYDPPLPVFQFPMNVGETWTSSSNIVVNKTCTNCTLLIPSNTDREITSIVDLALTVNVSGQRQTQTFRSFVLKEHEWTASNLLHYYSDDAGFWVKHEGFASNGTRSFEYSLTSFNYAPAPAPPDTIIIVIIIVIVAAAITIIIIMVRIRRKTSPNPPPNQYGGLPPQP